MIMRPVRVSSRREKTSHLKVAQNAQLLFTPRLYFLTRMRMFAIYTANILSYRPITLMLASFVRKFITVRCSDVNEVHNGSQHSANNWLRDLTASAK